MKSSFLIVCLLLLSSCARGLIIGSNVDPATGCVVMIIAPDKVIEVVTIRDEKGNLLCHPEWVNRAREDEINNTTILVR